MPNINDLREKRGQAIASGRAILEKAGDRKLTEEERTAYDKAISDALDLKERIEIEERQIELDREAATLAAADDARKGAGGNGGQPPTPAEIELRAFGKALQYGYRALNDVEQRALQMDDNTAGGYLVPPVQWVQQLIKAVDDQTFIRKFATKFQVPNAHSLGAPSLENDPADATWSTEIATVTEDSTMDFGNRELTPNPVNKLLKVSMKLMRTAVGAEMLVRDRLAYKFGITHEKAFLTGNGAKQPLGVMTASSLGISTSRDVSTGNTSTAIGADNLREVKYSIKGNYWANLRWIFHRDAVKAISKLKDGDGQYLWQPGISAGDPDRLLGFPVHMSEYQNNTFTTLLYVGILGDFSQYWIADSLDMTVQRLDELYAANSQVGFIGRMETDGMPVLEEAFARVKLA